MTLITIPSSPAFTQSDWGIKRKAVISESPFTGAQQVQQYDKAQWYCTLTLPPMLRAQASAWLAFFLKCEGRKNTFLLNDPDAKSVNGTATSCSVASGSSIGATNVQLNIASGKTINSGSYLQLGTGSDSRLYMVVDDNTQSGSNTQVAIQPPLKDAITTSTSAIISSAKGNFRMDSNDMSWSADQLSRFGVTFSCSEAL